MCSGPFGRICSRGPLTALSIIKVITGATIYCCGMWWPSNTFSGFINMVCFMSLSGLTLYNFMSAIFHGPGYLPLHWQPPCPDDVKYLQWCGVCQGYKAPRAHHCRRCGRCVLKMDHHCPWINNCVGWGNQAHFTAFLFFAVVGCIQSTTILSCSLYRALNRVQYLQYGYGSLPSVRLGLYGLILCVFSLGMSIGVVLAVGMLLYFQVKAIMKNRTSIEDWIMEKANNRRQNISEIFKYPYDLGICNNMMQVMDLTCQPIGDGITWPLVKGCNEYTLTMEQIEQKNEKRQRTKLYNILYPASGSWLPIMQGFKVCLQPPCTDEPRIKLSPGDKVLVTRWRRRWLFGEKLQPDLSEGEIPIKRIKGWFPRRCAVELLDGSNAITQINLLDRKIK